ncbi:fructokinase-like 2, chloroplastic [Hordeum vulgare]|nr:fructokinase-like 2, chloroplastic [Hordeum vulgare]
MSKKSSQDVEEGSSGEDSDAETPKTKKKPAKRGRKKATIDTSDGHAKEGQSDTEDVSPEEPKIVKKRGRKKAKYSFIPSGRPTNRLVDREIHNRMKDMFWSPDEFVRAPGGSSSNIALALAALGGQVVFMGKLGDDEYGQTMKAPGKNKGQKNCGAINLKDLNCTPPADEMDEDPVLQIDEDVVLQIDEDVGVEKAVQKRDSLDDKQKYAAYVALHTLCMSRGGKFNRDDKKKVADFFGVGVWNIQRVWKKAMRKIAQGLEMLEMLVVDMKLVVGMRLVVAMRLVVEMLQMLEMLVVDMKLVVGMRLVEACR